MRAIFFLIFLCLFSSPVFSLSCASNTISASSVWLDSQELDVIKSFSKKNSSDTRILFEGGFVTENLNTPSAGEERRWQINSLGSYVQGESSGEASISFSSNARSLNFSFTIVGELIFRIQVLGAQGSLLQEYSISDQEQFEFETGNLADDETLPGADIEATVSEIYIIIDGGEGHLQLSRFFYSGPNKKCGSSGGSIGLLFSLILLSLLCVRLKSRTR